MLSTTPSHIDIIHLLWNITGLWSLGYAETLLGSAHYLIITLLLIVVSSAVRVGIDAYAVLCASIPTWHHPMAFPTTPPR